MNNVSPVRSLESARYMHVKTDGADTRQAHSALAFCQHQHFTSTKFIVLVDPSISVFLTSHHHNTIQQQQSGVSNDNSIIVDKRSQIKENKHIMASIL